MSRVKPPVPVRSSSLDRRPTTEHDTPDKPMVLSFYGECGQGECPAGYDDTKTPTNENVHLLSNINNNYDVPRATTINVNQCEVPPPSYDQIT